MTARRGRRAVLPATDVPTAFASDASSLRFLVPLTGELEQKSATVDFTGWKRPKLAAQFAHAFRDDLLAPGTHATLRMVRSRFGQLRRFWRFLEKTHASLERVEDLTPALLDHYERWLKRTTFSGDISRRHMLARPIALLRLMEEVKPGTLKQETLDRVNYVSLQPFVRSRPIDAYSSYVAGQIRRAARSQIMEAAERVALDGTPAVPGGLHPNVTIRYAALLSEIDRTGYVRAQDCTFNRLWQMFKFCHPTESPPQFLEVHRRFHLTIEDVVAFLALLSLDTGIELECLRQLRADCLKNPAKGSVDVEYLKRRARGAEWKRLRVRDGGTGTPGGLIRLAIRLTARARQHKKTDALWVHISIFGFTEGMKGCLGARYFAKAHNLRDENERPLVLHLTRLRKTHKAEWYLKTNGQMEEFVVGHTKDVAANHYADIPALRHLHEETVAAALRDALDAVFKPRLVLPEEEQAIHADPDHSELMVPPDEAIAFLEGAQDVWLVVCGGFYDSPFAGKGKACPVPFWGCLECRNAVITSRKLPALIAFAEFLVAQREVLSAADWTTKFATAYRRIVEQILPAFPKADIAAARAIATARRDLLYLPPEATDQ